MISLSFTLVLCCSLRRFNNFIITCIFYIFLASVIAKKKISRAR